MPNRPAAEHTGFLKTRLGNYDLRRLEGMDVEAFLDRFGVERPWLERRVARQISLGNLHFLADGRRLAVVGDRWLWHDTIAVDLLEAG